MSVIWVDGRAKRNQPKKNEVETTEAKKTTKKTKEKNDDN